MPALTRAALRWLAGGRAGGIGSPADETEFSASSIAQSATTRMDPDSNEHSAKRRKVRRNCGACRRSKVKCDREEPCSRCTKLRLPCQYFEVPQDPTTEKLKELESEIHRLKTLLLQSESSPQ
ncbi:uncharacterized protein IWZ02DRAFT_184529 [Phyllosticta citriasiana]|uniref:Zn(2)-C6 fungal-type domain-containing protein n=1 Tax=Phyllosticta citriasiana TaxID=595635 RepID=A0ABR1KGJ5_9PEZI